ncbi:MAG: ribosomal-processing cysteine protease Prp [Erysipelotrichaceae bacterium]|nr:ribosomal-processing cysteine protease Prp [Erysipelotrichaceae bacterium]
MIRVEIQRQDNRVLKLVVSGHAESAPYGQDLVCAAVSSVMFGILNALDEMHSDYAYQIDDNTIQVEGHDHQAAMILKVAEIQLKTIQETNKKFIQIQEV